MIHGYLDPRASPGPAVEVKFAGLGLPLAFGLANRYRGEHDRARGSSGSVEPKGDVGTRRASPIWFRLRRVAEGGVAIVALRWVSTYLPDDVELVVKGRRRLQAGEPKFDPHKWEPDKELPEIGATFDRDEAEHWWAANIVGAQGWRSL
jgi:hypothetical protein